MRQEAAVHPCSEEGKTELFCIAQCNVYIQRLSLHVLGNTYLFVGKAFCIELIQGRQGRKYDDERFRETLRMFGKNSMRRENPIYI